MPFDADSVLSGLSGERLRGPILHLAETTSTNDVVAGLARGGHPEGTVVVADCQTAGRGRRGRSWSSPPGSGLLFSLLLRPDMPVAHYGLLVGVCGGAVAEGLQQVCGAALATKWPNDVLLCGRKVAGILVEGGLPEFAVVGIGVNLFAPAAVDGTVQPANAGALEESGCHALSREAVLTALLNELDAWYGRLVAGATREIITRLERLETTVGRHVRLTVDDVEAEANVTGLSPTGGLIVCCDGVTRELSEREAHTLRTIESETGP